MTDKQAAIETVKSLPDGASLEEISEELRIMVGIRRGRADIAAGRTKTHEEVGQLVDLWTAAWTTK